MKIVRQIAQLRKIIHASKSRGTVGLVLPWETSTKVISLIRKSKKKNRVTIVTIFVNPMQFDKKKILQCIMKHCLRHEHCIESRRTLSLSVRARNLSPDFRSGIRVKRLAKHLCGPDGPGLKGGAIVLKLFNLTQPDRAYSA